MPQWVQNVKRSPNTLEFITWEALTSTENLMETLPLFVSLKVKIWLEGSCKKDMVKAFLCFLLAFGFTEEWVHYQVFHCGTTTSSIQLSFHCGLAGWLQQQVFWEESAVHRGCSGGMKCFLCPEIKDLRGRKCVSYILCNTCNILHKMWPYIFLCKHHTLPDKIKAAQDISKPPNIKSFLFHAHFK